MAEPIFVDISDDGGVTATHPVRLELPRKVATTDDDRSEKFNTIRSELIIVGCRNIPNTHFGFDSSFVEPSAKEGFTKLARLFRDLTDKTTGETPPLSIFGHADPVGQDDYNSKLSGRRAAAVYGLLVRDTKIWDDLFNNPQGGDNWGNKALT